ncbi:class I SAM-dependent methyltransferase [Patescibacteria group bacterium]|nr:MAG: class I SAM-dependent methyltransferase [Patescibacteria group bacterium]
MKPYIQKILEIIKPEDRHYMLDLGCGDGEDMAYFRKGGFTVYGIDKISTAGIPEKSDIIDFEIKPNTYSLIVANNTLPFIGDKDKVKKVISSMANGLVKDGVMYLTLFGEHDEWFGKHGMSFFKEVEIDDFIESLSTDLLEKNIREGYGITSRGKEKFWHVLMYMCIKKPKI